MTGTPKFKEIILIRKDRFNSSNFESIADKAKTVIDKAEPEELLALTITMDSRFKVIRARLYTFDVFNDILSGNL